MRYTIVAMVVTTCLHFSSMRVLMIHICNLCMGIDWCIFSFSLRHNLKV